MSSSKILWEASEEYKRSSRAHLFIQALKAQGVPVNDWHSLYEWSIEAPGDFWKSVAEFCHVKFTHPASDTLRVTPDSPIMAAEWFAGARLNFAENLLQGRAEKAALIFRGETEQRVALTYGELRSQVASLSGFFRAQGIKPGDRVAALMPNINETVVSMLAAAAVGATFTSTAPAFGAASIVDRFAQVQPKILVVSNGYWYGSKKYNLSDKLQEVVKGLPSLNAVIEVAHIPETTLQCPEQTLLQWEEILATKSELTFTPLPFDHPLYILYSSGTTGKPKCIVHGAGGTLLEHVKELAIHTNVGKNDVVFYQTNCGWMMWNWLVSTLAMEATAVLYDGSPMIDDGKHLFRIAEEEGITVFGTNPKFLSLIEKKEITPSSFANLEKIKTVLSTGSPLLDQNFDFVYGNIKKDVCLASISGGTDIIGCFALGSPLLPVRKGELQTRSLGLKVEVFNNTAEPVTGEKGELVCTAPFPSMPIYFWNDENNHKFTKAYFATYPGVWKHGDFVMLHEHGGITIFGRSDAVLNPGGVRLGTAELYREVESFKEVYESLAIGQNWQGDTRVVLFVQLQEGKVLDAALESAIKQQIKTNASPFHVPSKIVQVPDIPRTRSGKIVEIAVRSLLHGEEPKNLGALANPEALEHFRNIPELNR